MNIRFLSQPIKQDSPPFPGDPHVEITVNATHGQDGCHTSILKLSCHQGTHLDTPFHFLPSGRILGDYPASSFYGPAVLIDLAPDKILPPRTQITTDMLEPFSSLVLNVPRVILHTGWWNRYLEPEYFSEHPFLTPEAARWLVLRNVLLLGIDTPSPDTPDTKSFSIHHMLFSANVLILENLGNLSHLPNTFTLSAFPVPLPDLESAPVAAAAIYK